MRVIVAAAGTGGHINPGLAIAKQGLAIKQKYDTSLGGALQVNGIIYALDSATGNFIDIVQKIKDLESS